MAPDDDFNHVLIAKGAKQVLDAGGSVQLGAHGQLQGLGAHWELWMLQQGGMTNLEAIRCATINGARALGLDKEIGSIEEGEACRPGRDGSQSAREHPELGVDRDGDAERPSLRREDAERDRQSPEGAGEAVPGKGRPVMRAVLAAAALAILAAPQDGAVRNPERFAAIIAAGPLTPGPTSIEIGVDHWATDEMRLGVAQLFQEGAQAALLEVLKRAGVAGYIRMPNHERLQAGYVQEEMRPDGGRRILMLCVRYRETGSSRATRAGPITRSA